VPDRNSFDYAVIRVVPHVERQEFINVGVIVFCRKLDYLDAIIDFELDRLKSLSPNSDLEMIKAQLKVFSTICSGGPEAGYFGRLSKSERFKWLVSPSSTIIQTSAVHSGICDHHPSQALRQLYELLVL
jgi:hypothetical protein